MTLISGFGTDAFGEDPFGQTNYGRKKLLENLPQIYRDEDRENDFLFTKFIKGLWPNINELRNAIDKFPLIRDAEQIPGDSITILALLQNLSPEVQVVAPDLPL